MNFYQVAFLPTPGLLWLPQQKEQPIFGGPTSSLSNKEY
jgi:hypothetical protein